MLHRGPDLHRPTARARFQGELVDGVWDLGLRLGFRVLGGLGFRVSDLGWFSVWDVGLRLGLGLLLRSLGGSAPHPAKTAVLSRNYSGSPKPTKPNPNARNPKP